MIELSIQLCDDKRIKEKGEEKMVFFSHEKISPSIIRIRDGSDVCEYLIIGKERAALIDTGYGIGDLKGYIETLTDKPYEVFITHGHVDHAAGAAQFSKVRMNLEDMETEKRHCTLEFRRSVLESQTSLRLPENEFLPQRTESFEPLEDGDVYDLGGITLRWIHVPGHTKGTMAVLIEEERVIMLGDACGVGVLLSLPESESVDVYLESLKKVQLYESLYDKVLRQHGTCYSTPHVVEDNIENCRDILAGTDDAVPVEVMGIEARRAKAVDLKTGQRLDGREGNILYDPKRIYSTMQFCYEAKNK